VRCVSELNNGSGEVVSKAPRLLERFGRGGKFVRVDLKIMKRLRFAIGVGEVAGSLAAQGMGSGVVAAGGGG
jgi:hypothetical protein